MTELGPGPMLLLMGVVTVVVIGCGAAVIWAIIADIRDRDRRRRRS
jgi:hypothetical protein